MIIPAIIYNNVVPAYVYPLYRYIEYNDVMPFMYSITINGIVINNITNKIVTQTLSNSGYYQVSLKTINGKFNMFSVHRLVASAFIINHNDDYNVVNHKNCNTEDNFAYNLEWCTQKQNIRYAMEFGNFAVKGEDNANARFTNSQIHEICKLMEKGMQYSKILETLNIAVNDKNLDILTKIRTKKL